MYCSYQEPRLRGSDMHVHIIKYIVYSVRESCMFKQSKNEDFTYHLK